MRYLLPLLAIITLLAACSAATPTPAPLNASAHMNSMTVTVTNNDTFAWQDVKIELRPSAERAGYSANLPSVPAGSSAVVGVSRFANRDGVRYDPASVLVQEVWVSCATANGRAYWFGHW